MRTPEQIEAEALIELKAEAVSVALTALDWAVKEIEDSLSPARAQAILDVETVGAAHELREAVEHKKALANRVSARAKELLNEGLGIFTERMQVDGQA